MFLKGASPALKCMAFHLTLSRAAEIWYSRLPVGSIRNWLDLKKAFLNQYLASKEGEAPIQRLQDVRQQAGKTLKSYLARFTDEMTYCKQVTDSEAPLALRGGFNMNTLFLERCMESEPNHLDVLMKMIKSEIVNEELIDHHNRTFRGPSPRKDKDEAPYHTW